MDEVSKIEKKDIKSIEWIYNKYGKKLYGYAISKWHLDEDSSWETVYKTLYKVVEVSDKYAFENENKFAGFLFKIFINYLRNHYRDNKKNNPDITELTEKDARAITQPEEGAEEKTANNLSLECLKKALQGLEDWKRILLLMRAQDFSYEEIAKYVNKPSDQLKVYYMRLKKQITESANECIDKSKNEI